MTAPHAKREPSRPHVEPVRLTVIVPLAPAEAFDLFTRDMTSWWPLATHSLGGKQASACGMEPRAGGAVWEEQRDGTRAKWGSVLSWDPPSRLEMTWHPGRDVSQSQVVEVRFEPDDQGCRVELEHRGWEALSDDALEVRGRYDGGWRHVLGERFADAARERAGRGDDS